MGSLPRLDEYPRKADLLTEIYRPFPIVSNVSQLSNSDLDSITRRVVRDFADGFKSANGEEISKVFIKDGAYWRDSLSLTYHLRTFHGRAQITQALCFLSNERVIEEVLLLPHSSAYVTASPVLSWVECRFTFKTSSPRARCQGRMMLTPGNSDGDGTNDWKIWVLSTWLEDFEDHLQDDARVRAKLSSPTTNPNINFETDVLIVGAGNSGLVLAARLKALGIRYKLVEKNEKIGDNWALRYDNLRFHTSNAFSQTPYFQYRAGLPLGLHRDDLGEHMIRFADALDLEDDVLLRTTVQSTSWSDNEKTWTIRTSRPGQVIVAKHLVLCTGINSSAPYIPSIPERSMYKGFSIHSQDFKNGIKLVEQGAKSVAVIGSANTAFDILEDCYSAGLKTTMVQRSPTYVVPMAYIVHPHGFGMFDHMDLNQADRTMFTSPLAIGGQLGDQLHAFLASQEPDRYKNLAESGFRVRDSTMASLTQTLMDRHGGHFVEMGTGLELLTSKKVGIRSGVAPAGYTATGLRLSDGSNLDVDAIIWCTGFMDLDVRDVVVSVLGEGGEDVRDRMDAVWGVDVEGEVRGVWKRHKKVDNFYILGGGTGYQRWYSKIVALQIKGALEGILPNAYRD